MIVYRRTDNAVRILDKDKKGNMQWAVDCFLDKDKDKDRIKVTLYSNLFGWTKVKKMITVIKSLENCSSFDDVETVLKKNKIASAK